MNTKLNHFEIENIELCLTDFEKLFKIKLETFETVKVKNFNELCDLIISKIDLKNIETCTSQQAFYKVRKAFIEEKIIEDRNELNPKASLKTLFPAKTRRLLISNVEKNIGFKFGILGFPKFVINSIFIFLCFSLLLLFLSWKLAVAGILISILGFYQTKFGNELKIKTVAKLVNKITVQNYLDVRTEKNSVNKSELKNVIVNWFSENACIEKEKLRNGVFA